MGQEVVDERLTVKSDATPACSRLSKSAAWSGWRTACRRRSTRPPDGARRPPRCWPPALCYWMAPVRPAGALGRRAMLVRQLVRRQPRRHVARVRHHERPRYGFYVDHVLDAVGPAVPDRGPGARRLHSPSIGAAFLIAYYLLTNEIALATHALGTFRISYWKFGPTGAADPARRRDDRSCCDRTEVTVLGARGAAVRSSAAPLRWSACWRRSWSRPRQTRARCFAPSPLPERGPVVAARSSRPPAAGRTSGMRRGGALHRRAEFTNGGTERTGGSSSPFFLRCLRSSVCERHCLRLGLDG